MSNVPVCNSVVYKTCCKPIMALLSAHSNHPYLSPLLYNIPLNNFLKFFYQSFSCFHKLVLEDCKVFPKKNTDAVIQYTRISVRHQSPDISHTRYQNVRSCGPCVQFATLRLREKMIYCTYYILQCVCMIYGQPLRYTECRILKQGFYLLGGFSCCLFPSIMNNFQCKMK